NLLGLDPRQGIRDVADLGTAERASGTVADVNLTHWGAFGNQEVQRLLATQPRAGEHEVDGMPGLVEYHALRAVGGGSVQEASDLGGIGQQPLDFEVRGGSKVADHRHSGLVVRSPHEA